MILKKSGLSNLIGELLKKTFIHSKELTMLILCLFGSLGTEFTSNLSMATILVPIVDSLVLLEYLIRIE